MRLQLTRKGEANTQQDQQSSNNKNKNKKDKKEESDEDDEEEDNEAKKEEKPQDGPVRRVEVAVPKNKTIKKKKTKLEKALDEEESVTVKMLTKELAKLELTEETREQLIETLTKSLCLKTLTLADMIKTLQEKKSDDVAVVLLAVLKLFKSKKGDKVLKATVDKSEVDVLEIIASGKENEALTKWLTAEELLAIAPVPDLSKDIVKLLQGGKSQADVLAVINKEFTAKQSAVSLAKAVVDHVLSKVFAEPKQPNFGAIEAHLQLLKRVLCEPKVDTDGLKNTLKQAQAHWAKNGSTKGVILALFQALNKAELAPYDALQAWREDREKTTGKMKALLQVNSWCDTLKPIVHEEDEGDESDDESEAEDDGF